MPSGTPATLNTEQLEQYTHQLAELSDQLKNLSQQVKQASSNTEIRGISQQVTKLSEQVKKHDKWFTPDRLLYIIAMHSEHPAFLDDLADLRRQLTEHQLIINWVRKKFNLAEKRQRKLA
jgi:small-conductance mechanosensitive channel